MPTRVAKKRRNDVVFYRNTKGKFRSGIVLRDQTASAVTPASSTSTSGGTLAAATYSYRVTAVYGSSGIETVASPAKTQVTTGATSTVTVDWTGVFPAGGLQPTSYNVYGRTGGSELLIANVAAPTLTYLDTGSVSPSGALPTDTGRVYIKQFTGTPNLVSVAKATTYKGTNVYVKR